MTVWTHTQGVFPLRAELVKALKMPAAPIRCIHVEGSGCYGHNGADDVARRRRAAGAALPGRPVRLQWMRDDEFGWEPYGPAMVMQRQGRARRRRQDRRLAVRGVEQHALDPAGVDRRHQRARGLVSRRAAEDGTADEPAAAGRRRRSQRHPALRLPEPAGRASLLQEMPIRSSALRTLGAYANVFASESFMDELAAAAGADPVAFRLRI